MHFDLVDIRLIVRIAEHDSLTKGAEASNISLPAASTRIKNLEESVGDRLFVRTSHGVTLTPSGKAFVHHARLILGQIERLKGDLQEFASGIKGHLRLFVNTTALGEFLPPILGQYLLAHPDVNIELRERLSQDIVRAVIERQTDIGIVAGTVAMESLESIPYRQDRLVLTVPGKHALAGRKSVEFNETLQFNHVGLSEGSAIHAFLKRKCEEINASMPLRIEVGNFETACRMIEAGVGVGILPRSAALRHIKSMDISVVHLDDPWSLRQLYICVREFDSLPTFALDLVEMLKNDTVQSEVGD